MMLLLLVGLFLVVPILVIALVRYVTRRSRLWRMDDCGGGSAPVDEMMRIMFRGKG